jgi:hypothetical protein
MTDFAAYQARILSYTKGKDPLTMQREMPNLLAELLVGIPSAKLAARPAPGKWSIGEIVAHLSETEWAASWRYRQMIEQPGVALPGYDQDLWEQLGDYSSRRLEDSLQTFRLLRAANLRMFARLTPEQWESHGIHSERGPMTVRTLAAQMAGHDRNHFEQIEKILGRRTA